LTSASWATCRRPSRAVWVTRQGRRSDVADWRFGVPARQAGITSISQLKGQTVAYTTGTAEQAFALRALATAGLTQKDVTQVT